MKPISSYATSQDYYERAEVGFAHETIIQNRLIDAGFIVDQYGQGALNPNIRETIRRHKYKTPLRFWPDIVASRRTESGEIILFIDAKTSKGQDNKDLNFINDDALAGALLFEQIIVPFPYFVVTQDFRSHRPREIKEICTPGKITQRGSGQSYQQWPSKSGTPWYRLYTHPYTELIGSKRRE